MSQETSPGAAASQKKHAARAQTLRVPGIAGSSLLHLSLGTVLILAIVVAIYGAKSAAADIPPGAITPTPSGPPGPTPNLCQTPVDISLVFDHSGSMSQNNKLPNAQQAATGFVDQLAGGDNDLSPHQIALTGISAGVATTDVALTTNAGLLKAAISGYTADGFTNIGRAMQLGQLQLVGGTHPDFLVLLSDGSANRPMDVDTGGEENDFYIDVNDNGYIDIGDGLDTFIRTGSLKRTTTRSPGPTPSPSASS